MFHFLRRLACVPALLFLSGCAYTDVGPGFINDIAETDPYSFTCCAEPEQFYPDGLIRTAFDLADDLGRSVVGKMYGGYQERGFPGLLAGNTTAEAALLEQLQPLDLVFSGNKSYVWGHLIPGRFSHDVIYLGTEAQLRAAGLWTLPALAPFRDDIRAGRLFIEAFTPVVATTDVSRVIEVDALAILRPNLSAAARRQAYEILATSLGLPYDYTFEVATTDRLACTELVNLAMPELRIATRSAYGRTVIFPDEIVSQAIRGERLRLIGYMVGTRGGFAWRNTHSLMADIAAYWGIPGSNP